MKKEGFSLVETLVVVAIIGLMSSVITPKVSIYLAKAKNARVISDLSTLRMASQMYYLDYGEPLHSLDQKEESMTSSDLKKLKEYFSGKIDTSKIKEGDAVTEIIGGSRETEGGKIKLGGKIKYIFKKSEEDNSNEVYIGIEKGDNIGDYTINNQKWEEL